MSSQLTVEEALQTLKFAQTEVDRYRNEIALLKSQVLVLQQELRRDRAYMVEIGKRLVVQGGGVQGGGQ